MVTVDERYLSAKFSGAPKCPSNYKLRQERNVHMQTLGFKLPSTTYYFIMFIFLYNLNVSGRGVVTLLHRAVWIRFLPLKNIKFLSLTGILLS